jgi:hypothetical protein
MELSAFIELLFTTSQKAGNPGRQEGATAEKAVPSSIPLFDGKPLVARIEARRAMRMRLRTTRGFLTRHL